MSGGKFGSAGLSATEATAAHQWINFPRYHVEANSASSRVSADRTTGVKYVLSETITFVGAAIGRWLWTSGTDQFTVKVWNTVGTLLATIDPITFTAIGYGFGEFDSPLVLPPGTYTIGARHKAGTVYMAMASGPTIPYQLGRGCRLTEERLYAVGDAMPTLTDAGNRNHWVQLVPGRFS